jgi:retron-type reverse transcriptase
MKTYRNLFKKLITPQNLHEAYWKARKHKSNTPAVKEFEKHWQLHLATLHRELHTQTYKPRPLKTFVLRDPKTRTICVSHFRDRIVHHALINILQPIFEPRFIHDSYASRQGKGTLNAVKQFQHHLHKVTHNGTLIPDARNENDVIGYALKADIKHYFDTVDHNVLMNIIRKRVRDDDILWLTRIILDNYDSGTFGKGMPLGNWTSQFFANIYLNELDQYVKHNLKAKHYIRYVDDFVILHKHKTTLEEHRNKIDGFLQTLQLELHPNKCCIVSLRQGITFLGYRIFNKYTLLRARNVRTIRNRITTLLDAYEERMIGAEEVLDTLYGWNAYAAHANTYNLRNRIAYQVEQDLKRRTTIRQQH